MSEMTNLDKLIMGFFEVDEIKTVKEQDMKIFREAASTIVEYLLYAPPELCDQILCSAKAVRIYPQSQKSEFIDRRNNFCTVMPPKQGVKGEVYFKYWKDQSTPTLYVLVDTKLFENARGKTYTLRLEANGPALSNYYKAKTVHYRIKKAMDIQPFVLYIREY